MQKRERSLSFQSLDELGHRSPLNGVLCPRGVFLTAGCLILPAANTSAPGGGWDGDPTTARQACKSYRRNPKGVAGDLLVSGNKKFSFGGYADYSDQNIAVRQLAPNKWQIVDRHYQDEEGGNRPGYKNDTYEATLDGDSLTIKQGKYTSHFRRCAAAQPTPPSQTSNSQAQPQSQSLSIGFSGEGRVDPRSEACVAAAKELGRGQEKLNEDSQAICFARNRHAAAYERFQSAYKQFITVVRNDNKLRSDAAVDQLKTFIKSCVAHKLQITTGGHNINIDIIPNNIAADCLDVGTNLIKAETADLMK